MIYKCVICVLKQYIGSVHTCSVHPSLVNIHIHIHIHIHTYIYVYIYIYIYIEREREIRGYHDIIPQGPLQKLSTSEVPQPFLCLDALDCIHVVGIGSLDSLNG